ncbi:NAD(P)H-dependent flavin oxidoreductase [Paramicrobacterium chengjingii]|uniref:Nitronate monooxygenase n=1 Tax=Paramicrobacterium chengjingii TaxID=2769067 RepID=A0ABX6YE80_9MICO|nr:nitronate monooxygenase [Microbacterium chengjingii]QPZ37108.1 nitronate monooxygenase [Microbacterium chengjingii]
MMNALSTLLAAREVPVFNASMAGAAGVELASAVSAAGGIGMLGVTGTPDLSMLSRSGERLHNDGAVWGAGFLSFALERDMAPLHAVLAHQPDVVSLGFGGCDDAITAIRETPAVLLAQVGNADELEQAADARVDGIIVRGSEAGGHGRNDIGALPFLQLAAQHTDIPLVAAGGVTTPRGLAAVIAAGAVGAWVGTRFAVATESQFPDAARQRVIDAQCGDTVYTRVFDIAQRSSWPPHYGGRALSNEFSDTWHGREDDLERQVATTDVITADMNDARASSRFDVGPIYAGEGSAMITRVETAAEIVDDFASYRDYLHGSRF